MRALTLHAPWATLCVTRQPHAVSACQADTGNEAVQAVIDAAIARFVPFVKRFETRSKPCPPSIIGQRIAIHQAVERPKDGVIVGEWVIYCSPTGPQTMMIENKPAGTWVDLPLGAVVGTAVIARSLPIVGTTREAARGGVIFRLTTPRSDGLCDCPGPTAAQDRDITDQLPYGDWQPGRHAYELVDVEVFNEPTPAKGKQGWWTWEPPT